MVTLLPPPLLGVNLDKTSALNLTSYKMSGSNQSFRRKGRFPQSANHSEHKAAVEKYLDDTIARKEHDRCDLVRLCHRCLKDGRNGRVNLLAKEQEQLQDSATVDDLRMGELVALRKLLSAENIDSLRRKEQARLSSKDHRDSVRGREQVSVPLSPAPSPGWVPTPNTLESNQVTNLVA